jgi:6-phosphogluconate dehydrogenase (decarboxylating)
MRIALIGYGKMGKAIEQIAVGRGHEIVLKIDLDNGYELTKENLSKADVAIEFTGPSSGRLWIHRLAGAVPPSEGCIRKKRHGIFICQQFQYRGEYFF